MISACATLAALQRRREWTTRLVQGVQSLIQQQMLLARDVDWAGLSRVPTFWRLAQRLPQVRGLRVRLLAYAGFWPERVRTQSDRISRDLPDHAQPTR